MDQLRPIEPGLASTMAELVSQMLRLRVRADSPSYRELEKRAAKKRLLLPRQTLGDVLTGKRPPRKALVLAFAEACGLTQNEAEAWGKAWEAIVDLENVPTKPRPAADANRHPPKKPDQATPSTIASGSDARRKRLPLATLDELVNGFLRVDGFVDPRVRGDAIALVAEEMACSLPPRGNHVRHDILNIVVWATDQPQGLQMLVDVLALILGRNTDVERLKSLVSHVYEADGGSNDD